MAQFGYVFGSYPLTAKRAKELFDEAKRLMGEQGAVVLEASCRREAKKEGQRYYPEYSYRFVADPLTDAGNKVVMDGLIAFVEARDAWIGGGGVELVGRAKAIWDKEIDGPGGLWEKRDG